MKAVAKIKNLQSDNERHIIIRNLSRILDIKVLEIDVVNGRLLFLYASPSAFQKVKQELCRLGYPIQSCQHHTPVPHPFKSKSRMDQQAGV